MRKLFATVLAGLLSCSSVAAAGPDLLQTSGVGVQENAPTRRPFAPEALRDEVRSASREARVETAVQQPPPKNKRWMERHPVWFGLIVGAGAGAALGAASCSDGCFPIGAGGAAMVGSWYGATFAHRRAGAYDTDRYAGLTTRPRATIGSSARRDS